MSELTVPFFSNLEDMIVCIGADTTCPKTEQDYFKWVQKFNSDVIEAKGKGFKVKIINIIPEEYLKWISNQSADFKKLKPREQAKYYAIAKVSNKDLINSDILNQKIKSLN